MPKGLSSQEAAALFSQYGPNDPAPVKRGAAVLELLLLFLNPLVIILLVACLASFILGQTTEASIILVIVLLGVAINFFQTLIRACHCQAAGKRDAYGNRSSRWDLARDQQT